MGKLYIKTKDGVEAISGGGGSVDLSGYAQKSELPTKVSQLQNDKGYLTAVPAGYAKTEDIPTKPSDIGAQPAGNYALKSEIPSVPVKSVNGKTGAVSLSASDVGADASGAASSAVSGHNANSAAHNDIRLLIEGLTTRINALANSTDEDLDQMAELVAYIKNNKSLIDGITTSKVNVSDIVNNLTTNVNNKPLSAAQGVALKALIDAITVPTKVSQLTNDKGYITGYTESDPTVPSWAKAGSKPSYTKSEVGLGNVDNVKQYSASNPPPYPVTSVNGQTGAVTLDASDVGARPSAWTPTAANVGAVPTSRKVNGKALSADITLSASDVSAVPTSSVLTVTGVDADGVTHTWTMYGVKN